MVLDDASLPPEGYRLLVAEGRIQIHARAPAGFAHARRTLGQLRRQYPASIPPLEIDDAPALAFRGVMLDVSRDRIPTMPALLAQTDLLASLKLNHLQLYIEHAFAYAGHEPVWRGADPITPDELRALDAHAASLGITLAANQNCFGHMRRWLQHPRYRRLAETHDEFDFYGIPRRGPFSLCPTDPASLALVTDLLAQQLACVSSGLVNIGCDETADLGAGRSRDAVRATGGASVYIEYVSKVCEIARALGARPMLWGDIALSHPDRLTELPDDATLLAWGYEPDSPFDAWGGALTRAGRDWVACPGTSSWRSVTGRTHERRANLRAAVDAAHANAARGILLTDWGDLGHRQQPIIAKLAIAEGAQAAWNPDQPPDPRAIDLHVFADRSLRLSRWLAELGDADFAIRKIAGVRTQPDTPAPLRNASAIFESLHPSGADTHLPDAPRPWHDLLDRLAELRASRPTGLDETTQAQLEHTLDTAEFGALYALNARNHPPQTDEPLARRLERIIRQHRRLWLVDARPGGLEDSTRHYTDLARAL